MNAEYFDQWYANLRAHAQIEAVTHRHLGLPPEIASTSLLSMSGLEEVSAALRLTPEQTLCDLGCGQGGYGLWLARENGCRLIGVDFSAVALEVAQASVGGFGLSGRADFAVGDLTASGLPDQSVDAVLCVDAIQFASVPAVGTEMHRILRPGGRVVVTCWETTRDDDDLPERLRAVDLHTLAEGGLDGVVVTERSDWLETERSLWTEAAAIDPDDDPALQSFSGEGTRVLATIDRTRRVIATAVAPG